MIVEEKIPFLDGKKYIVFTPNDIIKYNGIRLIPKKTLIFVYEETNDGFLSGDDELDIFGFGETEKDLKKDIISQIIFTWENYVEEDDSKLTSKAQELKRRYKETFEKLQKSVDK